MRHSNVILFCHDTSTKINEREEKLTNICFNKQDESNSSAPRIAAIQRSCAPRHILLWSKPAHTLRALGGEIPQAVAFHEEAFHAEAFRVAVAFHAAAFHVEAFLPVAFHAAAFHVVAFQRAASGPNQQDTNDTHMSITSVLRKAHSQSPWHEVVRKTSKGAKEDGPHVGRIRQVARHPGSRAGADPSWAEVLKAVDPWPNQVAGPSGVELPWVEASATK